MNYHYRGYKRLRTAEDVAFCYAALVALSFIPGLSPDVFGDFGRCDLDWSFEICELVAKDMR